jgi:hypothetical protein
MVASTGITLTSCVVKSIYDFLVQNVDWQMTYYCVVYDHMRLHEAEQNTCNTFSKLNVTTSLALSPQCKLFYLIFRTEYLHLQAANHTALKATTRRDSFNNLIFNSTFGKQRQRTTGNIHTYLWQGKLFVIFHHKVLHHLNAGSVLYSPYRHQPLHSNYSRSKLLPTST